MQKSNLVGNLLVLLIVTFLAIALIVYLHIYNNKVEPPIQKNERDSLQLVVNSIDSTLINNEQHYEKVVDSIVNGSAYDDSVFISEYLRRFIEKSYGDYIH